jgi:hypothetical protein
MKVRTVTVCTKAGIGKKAGHKKPVLRHIFGKSGLGKEISRPSKVILVRLLML